jgi:hypothetical protein
MGFKQIYGDTVMDFYLITKWILLEITDSGSYNVNEVGLKIGYSYRKSFYSLQKKFATTPKKYLMSQIRIRNYH